MNGHQVHGYWRHPHRKAAESVHDYLTYGVKTDAAPSSVWVDGADQGRVEVVEKVQLYVTAHGWCALKEVLRLKLMFEALVQEYHQS